MYDHYGKRFFDLVITTLAVVLLSPVFIAIALLVRIKLGTPVLFHQQRPGLRGNPFNIYKFRTMIDARDPDGNLLPDVERLPSFGRLLRSTSLDELPELYNVLKGDMSLVGPRPLLMRITWSAIAASRCVVMKCDPESLVGLRSTDAIPFPGKTSLLWTFGTWIICPPIGSSNPDHNGD
jgi:lipopolysaccharide/colanic/teichoic acid biosynthesis glycosyltransferase